MSKDDIIRMKDLPHEEKPREKLLLKGAETLTNQELLAVLIQTGTGKKSALDLASQVLCMDQEQGLQFLAECTQNELMEIRGIGPSKACQVLAGVELGKRVHTHTYQNRHKITSPEEVVSFCMPMMGHLKREEFRVCFLNTKNEVIANEVISIGSLNASIVHPREVFLHAIRRSAASVILVHNHPSGNPNPSREDIEITKRLLDCGQLLGIKVLDHIIIGKGKWYSLKSHGHM